MIEITIIDKDTTRAIGLKYLIEKYFDLTATILHPSKKISQNTPNSLYITTPEIFTSDLDFFIPKRQHIILITTNSTETKTINPYQEEWEIAEKLNNIITSIQKQSSENPQQGLSHREIDVLKLIALGYINKEIANKLSISINTVLTHRKNISSKLGIRSTSGLSVYAIMNGYITDNTKGQ